MAPPPPPVASLVVLPRTAPPEPPAPMHSMVLLELFQSDGEVKVWLLPVVVRKPRHTPPPMSVPKPQVIASVVRGAKRSTPDRTRDAKTTSVMRDGAGWATRNPAVGICGQCLIGIRHL